MRWTPPGLDLSSASRAEAGFGERNRNDGKGLEVSGTETLGALVLASAERHPDRTALFVDGCAVSYRELLAHGARIAGLLGASRSGGAPEETGRCAVLAARSLTAFAGVVGALLARQAYVPLNPRHPAERLAFAVETADAAAVVVDERSMEAAGELLARMERPLTVIMPDAVRAPDWARGLRQHRFHCRGDLEGSAVEGAAPGRSDDGAYLLFTSGSTGAPKGVLVRHSNAVAYLRSAMERYRPLPEDRFTQLFDLTFDLSVHDMFLCWAAGAALYCPPESAKVAPREFVRRNDLTFWFSVPSAAAFMQRLRMLRPGDFPSLRWSLFCGEALHTPLAKAWAQAAPNSIVENLYGPTEATIAITAYRLPREPEALARVPDVVPIGTALPEQETFVLGPDGGRAVPGEEGELCLGGSQVTDGYWRRPDLTIERFAPPAGATPASRWYRTGDRVRLTAEHGLVFMGRMDRQVKIAGHRVELQEVEAALRRAAGCDTAAAIAWPFDAGGLARGIVGFVADGARPSEAILEACRQILPPYMVPSSLRTVADWPVNDNGKMDYTRLRQMIQAME